MRKRQCAHEQMQTQPPVSSPILNLMLIFVLLITYYAQLLKLCLSQEFMNQSIEKIKHTFI